MFGVGAFVYPYSRYSVGLRAVDHMAEHLGLQWQLSRSEMAWVAYNDKVLLVRPRTYLMKYMGYAVASASRDYGGASSRLTVLYHEPNLPLGEYAVVVARPEGEALKSVAKVFNSEVNASSSCLCVD